MGKRIILIGIVASIAQIFLFGSLYDLIISVYQKVYKITFRRDLNWGITLYYGFIFYSIIVVIINLIIATAKVKTVSIIVCLLLIGIFDCYLFSTIGIRPYKTLLLLSLSNGLLLISFLVSAYIPKGIKGPASIIHQL